MRKNERFQAAMDDSGLVGQIEADFKGWGLFHIDNADTLLWLHAVEQVDLAAAAIMWMNESTFRYQVEPNTNAPRNPDDLFEHYDVGPGQLNVGRTQADIKVKFLNPQGIDLMRAFGTSEQPPDPLENLRVSCRKLMRIGQGTIVGPSETVLYPSVAHLWSQVPEVERNERRSVAYCGPDSRPARFKSWVKYSPLFTRFFQLYV